MVVLKYSKGIEYTNLMTRIAASADLKIVTTCVTLEEQLRGWLSLINRHHDVEKQVSVYDELNSLVDYFARWTRLAFDDLAAHEFKRLRSQKIRIGTMDLKIAFAGIGSVSAAQLLVFDVETEPRGLYTGLRHEQSRINPSL
jgi:tRNA(fMet)-specific endonuclease VapC